MTETFTEEQLILLITTGYELMAARRKAADQFVEALKGRIWR